MSTHGRYQHLNRNRAHEVSNAAMMGLGGGNFAGMSRTTTRNQTGSIDRTAAAVKTFQAPKTGKQSRWDPECIRRLREKLSSRGTHGIHGIGRLFRVMDDDGDKKLSKEELRYGLSDFGVKMNKVEVDEIFSYIDRDKSGGISFDELLRALRGPINTDRLVFIDMAYEKLDRNKDGAVTVEDLELYYDPSYIPEVKSGKQTPAQALREFLSQWDTIDKDGIVTREEFIEYYKNVSASIDNDRYFELMMRNAWQLAGGEGQCENTTIKRVLVTHANGTQSIEQVNEQVGVTQRNASSDKNTIRDELLGKGIVAVEIEDVMEGNQSAPSSQVNDLGNSTEIEMFPEQVDETRCQIPCNPPNYFVSTSQRMNQERNGSRDRNAKASIPDWIKYDKVQLTFLLYLNEPVTRHHGTFNPRTRVYDTEVDTSFIVRSFVAILHMDDNSLSISEVSDTKAEYGGANFLRKAKLQDILNPLSNQPYKLEDFVVGSFLTVKGKQFRIYDLDNRSRQFFAEHCPGVQQLAKLPLPQPTDSRHENQQPVAALNSHTQLTPFSKQAMCEEHKRMMYPENTRDERNTLQPKVPGTVLRYALQWKDQNSGTVSTLENCTRNFTLFYYLDDETVELREVNARNSGRGRVSLFNLKRQKLVNPDSTDLRGYVPGDFSVGAKIQVYGRTLVVVGCSNDTRQYHSDIQSEFGTDKTTTQVNHSVFGRKSTQLQLYSSPEQHFDQILSGIRGRIEQVTNYASREQNIQRLVHHMIQNLDNNGKLTRHAFRQAMGTYSIFDADADILYNRIIGTNATDNPGTFLESKEGVHQSYLDQSQSWGDSETDEVAARNHSKDQIQRFAQQIFPTKELYPSHDGNEEEPKQKLLDKLEYDSKLQGLIGALRSKLESLTNFGDEYHYRQKLQQVLQLFDINRDGTVSKPELRGALAKFNFWTVDSDYVFDALDVNKNGTLEYDELIQLCIK